MRIAPYGFKHEFAKRWPIYDWRKSTKVAKRINSSNADLEIYNLIMREKPALVGRLGGTEARFLGEYKKISILPCFSQAVFRIKPNWKKRSKEVNRNAGFFFNSIDEAAQFYDLYHEALENTDILGAWGNAFTYIESQYLGDVPTLVPVGTTAPWIHPYSEDLNITPWAKALENRKVLVISHFTETMAKQFEKIQTVFPGYNLHKFEIITLKAPMTINTKYPVAKDWFTLLDEVKIEMNKIDFDVALVSAGSYSYPLAYYAKQIGKIGIHSGGGLQLFFGIMGKRWENANYLSTVINYEWTRPSQEETPDSAKFVEDGCYW